MPPAPTVPLLEPCLGGEASRAGRFRVGGARTGGSSAASSGVRPKPKPLQVSPRAPRQGRSPGGSPLGRFGTFAPLPTLAVPRPKPRFRVRQDPRPKPRFCLAVHEQALGPPFSQLPGRSPNSARRIPRPKPRHPPVGSALTEVPLSAGQVLNPKVPGSCLSVSHVPEGRRETDGRFTKHAAFASAKGQARSFRLAAASSAALPFASPLCAW